MTIGRGLSRNFGDVLAPILLEHFAGLDVTWASPDQAEIISVGSNLDILPRSGWHGIVAGAGQLHAQTLTDLTFAKVLGVRGVLSRLRIQCGSQAPTIGDPVLLVPELVTPVPNSIEIGVMPHWSDDVLYQNEYDNALTYGYALPTFIDPTQDPLETAMMIGSCRKLVTSSLHGVIAADAFGIGRRAELAPSMKGPEAIHEGSTFKWRTTRARWARRSSSAPSSSPQRFALTRCSTDLFEMFQELGDL